MKAHHIIIGFSCLLLLGSCHRQEKDTSLYPYHMQLYKVKDPALYAVLDQIIDCEDTNNYYPPDRIAYWITPGSFWGDTAIHIELFFLDIGDTHTCLEGFLYRNHPFVYYPMGGPTYKDYTDFFFERTDSLISFTYYGEEREVGIFDGQDTWSYQYTNHRFILQYSLVNEVPYQRPENATD